MGNLPQRIKKRYDITARNWRNDCKFSKELAVYRLIGDLCGRAHMKGLGAWGKSKKDAWILNYLNEMLSPIMKRYRYIDRTGIRLENAPIWVCWWTGEVTAPPLVKQCIKSIRKNAGDRPVHLISEENYRDYFELPDYIMRKMKNGQIGLAHFSDYLRVSLLKKYGGLWLDATIFCAEKIPEEYFKFPFFTGKSEYRESNYISCFQWTTFCLGGWRGNVFYSFMKDAFERYWKSADTAIDYLFFDYLIYLAKENVPAVEKLMDAVPVNTPHRDDLQAAMNMGLPAEEFWNVVRPDTALYKLSWRETYALETKDSAESIYGYFLHMEI